METNKASMTALISAFGRAYHSLYDEPKIFDDFLARDLLTDEQFAGICGHMAQGISFFNPDNAHLYPDADSALRWVVQTQIAPTVLARSRYTEDTLMEAIAAGMDQYVILGAGYDTFAFRRPALLKRIRVFEVDHPATQAAKRERIAALGWETAPSHVFVPFDFSGEGLGQALVQAGYDPGKPGFFSWLGVSYYLDRGAITRTLGEVSNISARGSSILFDYPDERLFDPDAPSRVRHMTAMASAGGEPMLTALSLTDLAAILGEAGYALREHLAPSDIEARYFTGRADAYHAFENIHYAWAVRE